MNIIGCLQLVSGYLFVDVQPKVVHGHKSDIRVRATLHARATVGQFGWRVQCMRLALPGQAAMVCSCHPPSLRWGVRCAFVCGHRCAHTRMVGSWPVPRVFRLRSRTLPTVPDLPRQAAHTQSFAQPLGECLGLPHFHSTLNTVKICGGAYAEYKLGGSTQVANKRQVRVTLG